eukprot:evm.model.scf_712.2 EVM.evm.TU.scf_712.2   scf_712:32384-35501(+)
MCRRVIGCVAPKASRKPLGEGVRGLKKTRVQPKGKNALATSSYPWSLALFGSLFPWLQWSALPSKAAELMDASELVDATTSVASTLEAEVEAVDMGSLLAGDLAMLVAAPLVVYAALRVVFWGSQEESDEAPRDELLNARVRSMLKVPEAQSKARAYEWQLQDPELQALAMGASERIVSSIRQAKESCSFQSSLRQLVVKNGDVSEEDTRWIESVLKSAPAGVEDDIAGQSENLTDAEFCRMLTRSIAHRAALNEVDFILHQLQDRKGRWFP